MEIRRIAVAWLCGSFVAGCIVRDLDLDGLPCPCAAGYTCDELTETCVRTDGVGTEAEASTTSSNDASASLSTSSSSGVDVEDAFDVVSFQAQWSTPNAILWTWEVVGDPDDFHEFRLVIGESEEAVAVGADVNIVDSSVNPELGHLTLPRAQGSDPVESTLTVDLTPATTYYARLEVADTSGGTTRSPNVAVRSTSIEPSDTVTIFDDAFGTAPGQVFPSCYEANDTGGASGSASHYEFPVQCEDTMGGTAVCSTATSPVPTCWENLRWQAMPVALGGGFGPGAFDSAYLEFHLAVDDSDSAAEGPSHGWWADVAVEVDGELKTFSPLTYRADGTYRRYQIKLSEFGNLTHELLGGQITGFRVGTSWTHGSVAMVDEVRIHW